MNGRTWAIDGLNLMIYLTLPMAEARGFSIVADSLPTPCRAAGLMPAPRAFRTPPRPRFPRAPRCLPSGASHLRGRCSRPRRGCRHGAPQGTRRPWPVLPLMRPTALVTSAAGLLPGACGRGRAWPASRWSRNASRRPHLARSPRSAAWHLQLQTAFLLLPLCFLDASCHASLSDHPGRRRTRGLTPCPKEGACACAFGHASALKQDSISSTHHTFCRIAGFRNCSSAAQECAPASEAR